MPHVTCPICGGPHPKWEHKGDVVARPGTKFVADLPGKAKPSMAVMLPSKTIVVAQSDAPPTLIPTKSPIRKSGPKFDKTEYQREYMRRKRAEDKAAKEAKP